MHKEAFGEYASQKLKMLKPLNFTDKDLIRFLIKGITDRTVRTAAASISVASVDQFLEDIMEVINASGESSKRFASFSNKMGKPKTPTDSVSKSTSPNKNKSAFCVYCKNKGPKSRML